MKQVTLFLSGTLRCLISCSASDVSSACVCYVIIGLVFVSVRSCIFFTVTLFFTMHGALFALVDSNTLCLPIPVSNVSNILIYIHCSCTAIVCINTKINITRGCVSLQLLQNLCCWCYIAAWRHIIYFVLNNKVIFNYDINMLVSSHIVNFLTVRNFCFFMNTCVTHTLRVMLFSLFLSIKLHLAFLFPFFSLFIIGAGTLAVHDG